MLITFAVHVLISAEAEDGGNPEAVILIAGFVQLFEDVIIFPKGLDRINSEKCRVNVLSLRVHMLFMVLKDMFRNFPDALVIVVQAVNIDAMPLAVLRVIQLFRIDPLHGDAMGKQRPLIFHGEAQNVPVCDGVFYHISVEAGFARRSVRHVTGVEYVRCSSAVCPFVGLKNGCTGESDIVRLLEVPVDVRVHLSELGAVTLVNDKDHLLGTERVHQCLIPLGVHGISHLLDCRNDHLPVGILELFHQYGRAI